MSVRLAPHPVWAYRADGSEMDLARPDPAEIDLPTIAGRLSRIARFNGVPEGPAFSVAQHSVMGARAILAERRDTLLAALFLLHDGHEALLGDEIRPKTALIDAILPGYAAVWLRVKAAWDEAIYAAFDLPTPSRWTERQKAVVDSMDARMCAAEKAALLGPKAAGRASRQPPLRGAGSFRPWGAVKAEMDFVELARELIGEEAILAARLAAAMQQGVDA